MRIREIIVLGSFAPITIFSTKFTDSLTGNAKLAGFSLTVTAIISLVVMTALHVAYQYPSATVPAAHFSSYSAAYSCHEHCKDIGDRSVAEELSCHTGHVLSG